MYEEANEEAERFHCSSRLLLSHSVFNCYTTFGSPAGYGVGWNGGGGGGGGG